jgi:hypothetical protein
MDKKIKIHIVACILIISIVTILLIGAFLLPVLIRIDDSVDLGHQYRYIQDYPYSIIYHNSKEYEGVGTEVIPHVSTYNFDENFIIAKSVDEVGFGRTTDTSFWIIDKNKHQTYQFDSDSIFKVNLHQLNITITFN